LKKTVMTSSAEILARDPSADNYPDAEVGELIRHAAGYRRLRGVTLQPLTRYLDPQTLVEGAANTIVLARPDGRMIPFESYNLFYRDEREPGLLAEIRAELERQRRQRLAAGAQPVILRPRPG
ncbi:MAG TPA: hypothetical protein VJN44_02785, partial [Roseateles sp.]|nr:hypothetical protein [Roseateles sp.]